MVSALRPNTRLFLFNTRTRVMLGPFRPVGQAGMHLQPQAWNGQFALQVQVGAELGDGEIRHLKEEHLRRWLVYGSQNPRAFTQSLSREQAMELGAAFERDGLRTRYNCPPAPTPALPTAAAQRAPPRLPPRSRSRSRGRDRSPPRRRERSRSRSRDRSRSRSRGRSRSASPPRRRSRSPAGRGD